MKEQSHQSKRTITPAEKRDLMWNIIQPGDPYDIRKSMIASLPGQTKFMGPHLQLVCLLQAAEIERLCLYLEEHKVKLRQSERLELDRHSYEVQIKELTEKIADYQNYKRQTEKLKEYIRKQTIQLEQLQKQQNNIQLTTKYENSLRQIHSLLQEKEDLQEITRRQGAEINSLKQLGKTNEQVKLREMQILNHELRRMNEVKMEQDQLYKEKANKWELQRRRLQSQLTSMTTKYDQLAEGYRLLEGMNQSLKRELEKAKYEVLRNQQYKKTFSEYEERFVKVGEEITRLNELLKEKARIISQQSFRSKQFSESIRLKDEKLAEYELVINQLEKSKSILQKQQREAQINLSKMEKMSTVIKTYETSLHEFSIEVNRLSNILIKMQAENEQLKHKNIENEKQLGTLKGIERQMTEYKIKYGQIIKKLTDAELENTHLSQEIQRLNYKFEQQQQQRNQIQLRNKNYQTQFENLKSTIATLSSEFDRKNIERQSQIKSDSQAQIQRLKEIIQQEKQINMENEEKLGYYLRQIKHLESQLHQRQGYSRVFRSIYDSRQQLKGNQLSSEQKEEYVNDLQKRIKLLSLQLQNVQASSPQRSQSSSQQYVQGNQKRGQVGKVFTDQVQRLKDLLLNKQIQINRLTQINEQLRETLHNYKRRVHESPYSQSKEKQKAADSPQGATKQITKIEKESVNPSSARGWSFPIEQQISVATEENIYDRPSQIIYRHDIDTQVQPHKVLDKSKQKQRSIQKLSSDYLQQRKQYPYSYRRKQSGQQQINQEKKQKQQRQEQRRKIYQELDKIAEPATFKKYVQQQSQQDFSLQGFNILRQDYQQLLNEYQKLVQSTQKLKGQLKSFQLQNQLNEGYIVRQTDQIQLLNNQISHLRQRIDPRPYHESGQNRQLQHSYSLLLQKYNNLMYDNESLRSRLVSRRVQTGSDRPDDDQLRRLYAQNEELKRNCSTFSQYYNKIMMVNDQLERVNKILSERDREINQKDVLIRDLQIQRLNHKKNFPQRDIRIEDPTQQSKISLPYSFDRDADKLSLQLTRLQTRNRELQKIVKGYELDEPKQAAARNDDRNQWQSQLQSMSLQITRLNNLLANRKKDIEVLQQQNRSLSRNVDQGKKSSRVYQDNSKTITKYEQKIVLLSQEIERLNGLMRIKQQNYISLKSQYGELQETTKQKLTSYALQVDRLNQELSKIGVDMDQARSKNSNEKSRPMNNISDYQAKMVDLVQQIERLNRILTQNRQQQTDFTARQSKYRAEIQRLNNSLRIKVEESIMSQTKQKIVFEERKIVNRQLQEKSRQYQALIERDRVLEQENKRFKHHIGEYQKRVKGFYEQCERLQKIIKYLKGEKGQNGEDIATQLIQKNRFLIEQIQRLNLIVGRQTQELSDLRLSLADDLSLQKRINEDLALFVVLFAEIESLRNRLLEKETEVEQVRNTSIAARKF